jgi:hypothetical protein
MQKTAIWPYLRPADGLGLTSHQLLIGLYFDIFDTHEVKMNTQI